EAIDDILAAMTLGRHVSQEGVLMLTLVGYASDHRLGEALALHLPRLNAETLKDLKARLDALPPSGAPARGLRYEEKFWLDWCGRKVKEAKDRESLLALLALASQEPEGQGGDAKERARAFLEACGGNADGVLKRAEEARPSYALMAKKLELPPDEFEKEL